jgi:RNA polymerase sigma-70 factor (ECF subfamily)
VCFLRRQPRSEFSKTKIEEKVSEPRPINVAATRSQAADLQAGVLEACRDGDRDAFRVLFESCKDRVYSIALNFSGNEAAAHDISQEVFLKLFDAIRGFRGDSDFRTWLFRLVVNACMDERRSSRRFVSIQEAAGVTVASSQHVGAEQDQLATQIRSAMLTLSPTVRLPILLRYAEGLSYSEIADVLKCSMGTVASRLNRGHRLLAQQLAHLRGTL